MKISTVMAEVKKWNAADSVIKARVIQVFIPLGGPPLDDTQVQVTHAGDQITVSATYPVTAIGTTHTDTVCAPRSSAAAIGAWDSGKCHDRADNPGSDGRGNPSSFAGGC